MSLRTDLKFCRVTTAGELASLLPKKMTSRAIASISRDFSVLDGFYWQLWQSGWLLTRALDRGLLQLWNAAGDSSIDCPAPAESRFWWQLPKGKLADKLKELLSLHAFVVKCQFQLREVPLEVLSQDEKIITRIQLITLSVDNRVDTFATIRPLRGYKAEYSAIVKALSALQPKIVAPLTLRQLLIESGLSIDASDSTGNFQLSAEEPAAAAVCKMAHNLLLTASQYEQGLRDDIDTEFVHQYRVNIRKSRSLVSLFKKTFSAHRYQQLKAELKTLGSRTNELRDLDVFLLDEASYREMLPDDLQAGLTQIFTRVKRRRTLALEKVIGDIDSAAYRETLEKLLQTLKEEPENQGRQAQIPIQWLVCRKVLAQYQQIRRDGAAIDASTADDALHELRIECKKLRYLLELFAELFDKNKLTRLIRQLKKLQDNLGHFNDFSVQREFLLSFARGRSISSEQLASINGLSAVLLNKQLHERGLVVDHIASFIDDAVQQEFQLLFATPSGEESS